MTKLIGSFRFGIRAPINDVVSLIGTVYTCSMSQYKCQYREWLGNLTSFSGTDIILPVHNDIWNGTGTT